MYLIVRGKGESINENEIIIDDIKKFVFEFQQEIHHNKKRHDSVNFHRKEMKNDTNVLFTREITNGFEAYDGIISVSFDILTAIFEIFAVFFASEGTAIRVILPLNCIGI